MTTAPPRSRVALGAIVVAIGALVAWSVARRWDILDESPFPVGIDGYFYPTQLRALLERHTLAYPDLPLAYLLMAPFALATDPVVGAKLAAAVLCALIVVPAYGVGARLGRSAGAGLVAAALAATSAGSTYLTIEFVKNGIGMTIALGAVWLVLRACDRASRARVGVAIAGALAAVATHKLAGAFVLAVGAPAVLAAVSERALLRGRRLLYAIGGLALLGALGVLVFAQHLLGDAFSTRAELAAPALAREGRTLLAMGHEALIGAVLAWVALALLAWDRGPELARPARVVGWATIALAIAIAFPWLAVEDPQGLAFRLRVIAFLPMALSAAIVAGAAHRAFARFGAPVATGVLVAAALAIVIAMPSRRIEGRIVAHPAMVAAVQAMTGDVPEGDVVVVPERHIMFMVAWYTRIPVRLSPDAVPEARRWRAMPLAFIGAGSPLDQLLLEARSRSASEAGAAASPSPSSIPPPIGLHPRHPNGFVLVPEVTWAWLLEQLPPGPRAHYAAWPTI